MSTLAIAFVAGALVTFGLASLAGVAMRSFSPVLRMRVAGAVLIALAIVDMAAMWRKTYCPLGPSRQTPKALLHRFRGAAVFAVWGFDTGLAVTTFRVAAVTWAALALTALGFASWWAGVGYGLAFVLPLAILLVLPADIAELERRLRARAFVQAFSATVLLVAGVLLSL